MLLVVVHVVLEIEGNQLRNEKLKISPLLGLYQVWVETHSFQLLYSTWLVLEEINHCVESGLFRELSALELKA